MVNVCRFLSRRRFDLLDLPWWFFCGTVAGSHSPLLWWFVPAGAAYLVVSIGSYIVAGGREGTA